MNLRYFDIMTLLIRETFSLLGPLSGGSNTPQFDEEAGKLVIGLDFPRGSRFACPVQGCGESACGVHDAVEKSWRHLDFWLQVFLSARVPRVSCPEHGVHLVAVPWLVRAAGSPCSWRWP